MIDPKHIEAFKELREWCRKYDASIYAHTGLIIHLDTESDNPVKYEGSNVCNIAFFDLVKKVNEQVELPE